MTDRPTNAKNRNVLKNKTQEDVEIIINKSYNPGGIEERKRNQILINQKN